MKNYNINDIVKVEVTSIKDYGVFVKLNDVSYAGLIHISELSNQFVRDISKVVNIGDQIYAEILTIDDDKKQIRFSIKNIAYDTSGKRLQHIPETESGFRPLEKKLDIWINKKIKEITKNI